MRCLEKNKTPFYICKYLDKTEIRDINGNRTGEFKVLYSQPIMIWGNVSIAKGDAQTELFGNLEQYDRVIVLDNTDNISISDVLFVDSPVKYDSNNNPLYDYEVTFAPKGAKAIAISKVAR